MDPNTARIWKLHGPHRLLEDAQRSWNPRASAAGEPDDPKPANPGAASHWLCDDIICGECMAARSGA